MHVSSAAGSRSSANASVSGLTVLIGGRECGRGGSWAVQPYQTPYMILATALSSRDLVNVLPIHANAAAAASRVELQRHYIGGQFRESFAGGTFETLNPTTNE